MLYEKMSHPPKNLTGIEFRSADGSDGLGKTGSVYARSALPYIPPERYPPGHAHKVFKQLLQRDEQDGIEKVRTPYCIRKFPVNILAGILIDRK
jgi:hypothetical protein